MIGWLAASLAGHDKNKIYIIIEETDEYVWLADGALRCLENPKKKKTRHVQLIKKNVDESLTEMLKSRLEGKREENSSPVRINEMIKRNIKLYQQSLK